MKNIKYITIRIMIVLLVFPSVFFESNVSAGTNADNRQLVASAPLDENKVIIFGGNNGVNHLSSALIYNYSTNTWSNAASMKTARFSHAAVRLLDGGILGIGGNNFEDGVLESTEIYNPETNTWMDSAPMSIKRASHAAAALPGGKVIVTGGGNDDGDLKSTEIYDPITNTWTPGPDMNATRKEHSAVLLDDGRVMVIGGMVNGIMSQSTEIYDSVSNTWSNGADLPTPIYVTAAAKAEDGRVYVSGGFDSNYTLLNSAFVYDSETNTWSKINNFINTGRLGHTSSPLLNGKVIFVTGGAGNSGPLDIYNHTQVIHPTLRVYRPQASILGGSVPNGTKITLSSKTQGAVIHYTTDGSEPAASSAIYSEPIQIDQTMTIKAIAMKEEWTPSQKLNESYTVDPNSSIPDDGTVQSADLSNLTVNIGTLTPAFSSSTTSYTVDAENYEGILKVIPYLESNKSKVSVNGKPVLNGIESEGIVLGTGENVITVEVSSSDETQRKTYTLTVNRASEYHAYYDASRKRMVTVYETVQNLENHGATEVRVYHPDLLDEPQQMMYDISNWYIVKYMFNSIENSAVIKLKPSYDDYVLTYSGSQQPTIADIESSLPKNDPTFDEYFKNEVGLGYHGERIVSAVTDPNGNLYFNKDSNVYEGYIVQIVDMQLGEGRQFKLVLNSTTNPSNPDTPGSNPSTGEDGGNDGGGSTGPTPGQNNGGPSNSTEIITVDVDGKNGENLNKTPIQRTTESTGIVKDYVSMPDQIAKATVLKAKESGNDTARIMIPDIKDVVSETKVEIPKTALTELRRGNLNLEIFTENATISIPKSSLLELNDDLYFRLVPIKKEDERKQVEERAKKEEVVKAALGDGAIKVVGRPMTIETNLTSRKVDILMPLFGVALPEDVKEREDFLNNLGIFIEHSDGDRVLVKPDPVEYKKGLQGLKFTIEKFSTFTIVEMDNLDDYFNGKNHKPYIHGYDDGDFHPEAFVSRAQMAAMLARNLDKEPTAVLPAYQDASSQHWAYADIMEAKNAGIMLGATSTKFDPGGSITRAQMAAIAYRWIQAECKTNSTSFDSCGKLVNLNKLSYKDVSANHWAFDAIYFLKATDIMVGYDDGAFHPEAKLSRAQAVKVLNRLFKRGPLTGVTTPTFKGVATTHWAFGEIEEAAREHQVILSESGKEELKN